MEALDNFVVVRITEFDTELYYYTLEKDAIAKKKLLVEEFPHPGHQKCFYAEICGNKPIEMKIYITIFSYGKIYVGDILVPTVDGVSIPSEEAIFSVIMNKVPATAKECLKRQNNLSMVNITGNVFSSPEVYHDNAVVIEYMSLDGV